jgi:hypothetical protein
MLALDPSRSRILSILYIGFGGYCTARLGECSWTAFQFFTLDSWLVVSEEEIRPEDIALSILYIGFPDPPCRTRRRSRRSSFNSLHWILVQALRVHRPHEPFNSLHWILLSCNADLDDPLWVFDFQFFTLDSGTGGRQVQVRGGCHFQFFTLDSRGRERHSSTANAFQFFTLDSHHRQ